MESLYGQKTERKYSFKLGLKIVVGVAKGLACECSNVVGATVEPSAVGRGYTLDTR